MSPNRPRDFDPSAFEELMEVSPFMRTLILSIGLVASRRQFSADHQDQDPDIIEGEIIETRKELE